MQDVLYECMPETAILLGGSPMSFRCLALLLLLAATTSVAHGDEEWAYPPGWMPVAELGDALTWREIRDIENKVHLYLPSGHESVRGIFVCFVFHSSDPRELARLWNFALVTVPWPFEYDLGHNDKRNGRYELGHEPGDMGLLLRYLDDAGRHTKHPELSTVPIVGWLGQNGSHLAGDLFARAPERVLAWSDSFPKRLRQYPELTRSVPFAFAWEISKRELREGEREYKEGDEPMADLACRANTYGFGHGIYSKYNFFVAYLDRCIRLRMPDEMPPPGEPVTLEPVVRENGWVGDFDPIGTWNPIHPAGTDAARSVRYPCWLPDEYAAWTWRSYHSTSEGVKLAGPVVEYRKKDGKWGGPECGLGYGGDLAATDPQTFAVKLSGEFASVEYHDGHRVVGTASEAPWEVAGVRLEPGLHALFAVGVGADGSRSASRPAFVIVQPGEPR